MPHLKGKTNTVKKRRIPVKLANPTKKQMPLAAPSSQSEDKTPFDMSDDELRIIRTYRQAKPEDREAVEKALRYYSLPPTYAETAQKHTETSPADQDCDKGNAHSTKAELPRKRGSPMWLLLSLALFLVGIMLLMDYFRPQLQNVLEPNYEILELPSHEPSSTPNTIESISHENGFQPAGSPKTTAEVVQPTPLTIVEYKEVEVEKPVYYYITPEPELAEKPEEDIPEVEPTITLTEMCYLIQSVIQENYSGGYVFPVDNTINVCMWIDGLTASLVINRELGLGADDIGWGIAKEATVTLTQSLRSTVDIAGFPEMDIDVFVLNDVTAKDDINEARTLLAIHNGVIIYDVMVEGDELE